jgi:hypothetical protein
MLIFGEQFFFMKYLLFLLTFSLSITLAGEVSLVKKSKAIKDSLFLFLPKSITLSPQGNVFIWLNSACPICNKYPGIWKKLAADFPEITFIGVFTSYENKKMAKGFIRNYNLPFQWFMDENNNLANFLKVKTTPEVLFISPNAAVIYRGATDDWFYALGKNKTVPQHFYLKNAMKEYQNNQPVLVFKTDPIGCIFIP